MCGIFGIVNNHEAAHLTAIALHALQHRGQEAFGIVSTDLENHYTIRRAGLVGSLSNETSDLKGSAAIGHVRYSTAGGSSAANIQPLSTRSRLGWLSIAHNGNLTNATSLIKSLERQGSIFQSSSDTEVIFHLLAKYGDNLVESLPTVLSMLQGAYSMLIMNHYQLIVARDPFGFRPLVMGTIGDGIVFASETTAFDLIGADYVREVHPGEMLVVDLIGGTYKSHKLNSDTPLQRCIFEHVYFSKPDSNLFGANVYEVRRQLGRQLAKEQPAEGDLVIPVPDSGLPAAIGYAEESKIPFDMGLIRSHFVGRSFIEPKQAIRDFAVHLKFSALSTVKGQRLIIIDDSLVRGTTSRKIIKMLREVGAKEIHLRISAPPTISPCIYGIDTPTREELIASKKEPAAIAELIGADSLAYLSLDGLVDTVSKFAGNGWCHACFSGKYPQGGV